MKPNRRTDDRPSRPNKSPDEDTHHETPRAVRASLRRATLRLCGLVSADVEHVELRGGATWRLSSTSSSER